MVAAAVQPDPGKSGLSGSDGFPLHSGFLPSGSGQAGGRSASVGRLPRVDPARASLRGPDRPPLTRRGSKTHAECPSAWEHRSPTSLLPAAPPRSLTIDRASAAYVAELQRTGKTELPGGPFRRSRYSAKQASPLKSVYCPLNRQNAPDHSGLPPG